MLKLKEDIMVKYVVLVCMTSTLLSHHSPDTINNLHQLQCPCPNTRDHFVRELSELI